MLYANMYYSFETDYPPSTIFPFFGSIFGLNITNKTTIINLLLCLLFPIPMK